MQQSYSSTASDQKKLTTDDKTPLDISLSEEEIMMSYLADRWINEEN